MDRCAQRAGSRSRARRLATTLGAAAALGMASTAAAEPRRGEPEYVRYCGACHGTEADGRGPAAPALEPPPSDLTRIAERRGGVFPDAAVLRLIDGTDPVVAHGTRAMPIWGERFRDPMGSTAGGTVEARGKAVLLVQYLKSIQVGGGGSGP